MRLPLFTLVIASLAGGASAWTEDYFLDESLPVGLEENVERSRPVAAGIENHQVYLYEDPFFINWVRTDLTAPGLAFRAVKGEGRVEGNTWISAMAPESSSGEWYPVAAINGDFWGDNGRPVGLCVVDGRLLTLGNGRPAVARTTDGQWHMDRMRFDFTLQAGEASVEISDLNLSARIAAGDPEGAIFLYTRDSANPEFPLLPPARLRAEEASGWSAVELRGSDTVRINETAVLEIGDTTPDRFTESFPAETMLLVGYGPKAPLVAALARGGGATLRLSCAEFDAPVDWALGGGPILLRDGEVMVSREGEAGFRPAFVTDRHPRSVIGFGPSRESLILMVVDGRQPDLSRGMDLIECAEWMRNHGMVDAMNFDGGGSSSLWVRGSTESSPADADGEREVTNGLVLLSSVRSASPRHFRILPHDALVPAGIELPLEVSVFDEGWNPLEIDADPLIAQLALTPIPGSPDLAAITLGASAETRIERAPIAGWEIHPDVIELASNEEVAVGIRARDEQGRAVQVPRDSVTVAIEPADLASLERDPRGRLILHGSSEGMGEIRITWNDASAELPAAEFPFSVGDWEKIVAEGFETTAELPSLELNNFDPAGTRLSWTSEETQEGERALAIDYAMTPGGTSAAYVTLDTPLPPSARQVGLWVYGDGGNAWLRGVVSDSDGEQFLVDFTQGTRGIHWSGEWNWVRANLRTLRPHWSNPDAQASPPFALHNIYLAQTREAAKTSGRILIDSVGGEVLAVRDNLN